MINVMKAWGEYDQNGELIDSSMTTESVTFRELVYAFRRQYTDPSASTFDWRAWASSYQEQDYLTGNYEINSLHLADESKAKYWVKAWRMAQRSKQ